MRRPSTVGATPRKTGSDEVMKRADDLAEGVGVRMPRSPSSCSILFRSRSNHAPSNVTMNPWSCVLCRVLVMSIAAVSPAMSQGAPGAPVRSSSRDVRSRRRAIDHGPDARRCPAVDGRLSSEERRWSASHHSHSPPVQQGDLPRGHRARRLLRVARLCRRGAGRPRQVRVRGRVPRLPGGHDRLVRHVRLDRHATVVHRAHRHVRMLLPRRRSDRRGAAATSQHIAAIAQAAGGNIGRVGRRREFWGSVEGGAFAMSINFGWMPVFASTDKGARPAPNVDLASFFKTLPVIDMTDRAGSPSWDWRNFLERSPDDPWWDKQGYLTASDSRQRRGAARLVVVRHGGGGARGGGDLPQERAERPSEERAVRHHLADRALRVGGGDECRRRSVTSTSATRAFATGTRISRGSIAGSRVTSTRSIRSRASSTT